MSLFSVLATGKISHQLLLLVSLSCIINTCYTEFIEPVELIPGFSGVLETLSTLSNNLPMLTGNIPKMPIIHNQKNDTITLPSSLPNHIQEARQFQKDLRLSPAKRYPALNPNCAKDPEFCGLGVQLWRSAPTDTCNGDYCAVREAVCKDGRVITLEAPLPHFTTLDQVIDCEITQIYCLFNNGLVNLKETYGATQCKIKFAPTYFLHGYVNGIVYDQDTFFVHVACAEGLNYGWFGWGYTCNADQLMCGNTVVSPDASSYQNAIINGNCNITKNSCDPFRVPRTTTQMNLTCGTNAKYLGNVASRAPIERVNVPCTIPDSPTTGCFPALINCGGKILNANVTIQRQSRCSIYAMNCSGSIVRMPTNTCVPVGMTCNDQVSLFYNYTGPLSACTFDQMLCNATRNVMLSCPQASKCSLNAVTAEVPCENKPMNSSKCECPQDRSGNYCEIRTPIHCKTSLRHPTPSCLPSSLSDPKDSLLEGDPKCTVFTDYKADANLGFFVDCEFESEVPQPEYEFNYFASSNKINISCPQEYAAYTKVMNFKQFSDMGLYNLQYLEPAHLTGKDPVWLNVSLGNIPDKYWTARRLYYELGTWTPYENTTYTGYIDAPTKPISTASRPIIGLYAGIFIVCIGAVIIGFFGYRMYKKYSPKDEKIFVSLYNTM